jgi:hypothetical protein
MQQEELLRQQLALQQQGQVLQQQGQALQLQQQQQQGQQQVLQDQAQALQYQAQLLQQRAQQQVASGCGIAGFGIGGAGAYTDTAGVTVNNAIMQCNDGFGWNGSNCVKSSAEEVTISCHVDQAASCAADGKSLICSNATTQIVPNTSSNKRNMCPNNFSWNGSNCVQNLAQEVTISCHANQTGTCSADGKSLICSNPTDTTAPTPTNTPAQFTNVNGFKSRKSRNVESFSQNMNGKCKARY